jgi:hypothetical protein
MDEITKAVEALGNAKREVFQNALNHFGVPDSEKEDRVKVYYNFGLEQVFIDQHLVLTFSPLSLDLDGKVKMDFQEHYLKEDTK